jgi:hypothetical protein
MSAPRQAIGLLLALASVRPNKVAICVAKLKLFVVAIVDVKFERT